MFGLVSKKKYDELESRYRETRGNLSERCYAKILDMQAYERLQKQVIGLQKEKQSMQEEIAHWKQMYADEVQKRVDFCEKLNGN